MSELPIIAECQRCGRGFVYVPDAVTTDKFPHPNAYHRGDTRPCGGKLERAAPLNKEEGAET